MWKYETLYQRNIILAFINIHKETNPPISGREISKKKKKLIFNALEISLKIWLSLIFRIQFLVWYFPPPFEMCHWCKDWQRKNTGVMREWSHKFVADFNAASLRKSLVVAKIQSSRSKKLPHSPYRSENGRRRCDGIAYLPHGLIQEWCKLLWCKKSPRFYR